VKSKLYVNSKIFSPPRLLMGRIYFGACNGIVYEVDRQSCVITGMHQLADAVTNAVVCNRRSGHFYALTYANELVAFERSEVEDTSSATTRANHVATVM
jgi:hypothetical protein